MEYTGRRQFPTMAGFQTKVLIRENATTLLQSSEQLSHFTENIAWKCNRQYDRIRFTQEIYFGLKDISMTEVENAVAFNESQPMLSATVRTRLFSDSIFAWIAS